MSRCHNAIGPNAHMAAYKRPPLYKSESHTQNQRHINKNNSQISLSIQLDQNHNKLKKLKNKKEFSQTLTVFCKQFKVNQWSFATALRDSPESSSLSSELLQFKQFKIRSTRPRTLNTITEATEKKKERKIQRF